MRTKETRQLRKIAKISATKYELLGFYITGSMKTFTTKHEAIKYAKKMGWKVTNPLKI